jgi:SAM-dependent methyltransferase
VGAGGVGSTPAGAARRRPAKLTGERPIPGATPDSLLGLHAAGYREVAARLGGGVVLDAGCGLGFESARLASAQALVVGIDRDPRLSLQALESFGPAGLRVACTDASRLGLRSGSVDYVCSSHVIEHFETPGRHVAEVARVMRRSGTAFILTPNAPWDYENPFHLVLFRAAELASLLGEHFGQVWVGGLEGSPRARQDFAARRAKAARLLGWADPLDLRHRVPRSWWVATYARLLPWSYRLLSRGDTDGSTGISADDYHLQDAGSVTDDTPVLFAVARLPLQPA